MITYPSSAAVIKMEGGTDFDLQVLEVPTAPVAGAGESSSTSGVTGTERSLGGSISVNSDNQNTSEAAGSRMQGADEEKRTSQSKEGAKVRVLMS